MVVLDTGPVLHFLLQIRVIHATVAVGLPFSTTFRLLILKIVSALYLFDLQ